MLKKILKAFVMEKVPVVVCAVACIASALMGIAVGYLLNGISEQVLAYGDYAVYQPNTTHMAAVAELYEPPTLSHELIYDEPTTNNHVTSHMYVVTILGGYIAIYHAEEHGGGLKEITSTTVGNLDPEEQQRLEEGIKIYSDEALALILQDYGS
ncbi:MAG: hypothetical protein FWC92_01360 [Defluviitaleaceae bacterium]|nr:hypothetical protein [Defluviitaleaceae bacterium]